MRLKYEQTFRTLVKPKRKPKLSTSGHFLSFNFVFRMLYQKKPLKNACAVTSLSGLTKFGFFGCSWQQRLRHGPIVYNFSCPTQPES